MAKSEKNYILRNGAAPVYLTGIETVKGKPIIYHYDTKDPKKAKRFTEEEARELAEKRHAVMERIR